MELKEDLKDARNKIQTLEQEKTKYVNEIRHLRSEAMNFGRESLASSRESVASLTRNYSSFDNVSHGPSLSSSRHEFDSFAKPIMRNIKSTSSLGRNNQIGKSIEDRKISTLPRQMTSIKENVNPAMPPDLGK